MVNAKNVVARFKQAFNWVGVGDDQHIVVDTKNGKWIVKVRLKTFPHNITKFYVAIQKPDETQLRGPKDYRLREEAIKEANIWVRDLKKNGTANLVGWKPDT
jgi:hypothetical protein